MLPKRLLPALLPFVLAGVGQSLLSGPLKRNGSTLYGWLLYAVAAVLFVMAFRHVAVARFALGRLSAAPESATPTRLSRLQWVLLVLTVVVMVGSLVLFGRPATVPSAWNLHIVSVLLFMAAFIRFDNLHRSSLPPAAQVMTGLLRSLPIVAVLALATFARLWQIDQFPFGSWNDEALNGLEAIQILKDASFRPIFSDATQMPAHFNYLIAASFSIFGTTPFALRLVTTAFGIVAVLFAYLLFRRWFGAWVAVAAACMLAVMRYHLTFSRFGMQGIATPAFEFAALYFLDRALAEKKVSDFAWLGLMVGFGLAFYFAFRLFPIVLAVFLLGLLAWSLVNFGIRETSRRYIKGLWPHWLIAALALLIAIMPVVQFAVRNREDFFQRTATTSLFTQRDEPNLAKAYWNNLSKHLLMFNVQGDRNGRHNLPEAPMLDPVMGVLFILGLAYALWHWRDPPNALMLLLFVIMLHGGVLSLDFEAPQSLRSIGIIPALVYFITLPLAVIANAIGYRFDQQAASEPTPEPAPAQLFPFPGVLRWSVVVVVLLAVVTYLNFDTFFNKQRNDPGVWAAYSGGETLVANEMNRLAANYDFVLSATYDNHPTVHFLANNITNHQRWTITDRLPIVHGTDRGVVLMFDGTLLPAYNEAKRLYRTATFQELHPPAGTDTVLYEAILTPDDLRAVSGVEARYFEGDAIAGQPAKEEVLPQVAADWTNTQPIAEPFAAELRSTLHVSEYGSYRFTLRGAPNARLWIDENLQSDAPLTLARGNHALRLQLPGEAAKVELWWQPPKVSQAELVPAANLFRPPVTNSGLLGAYYPSPDWSGDPAFTQIDPEINFYFQVIPLDRPYSVEWKGKLFAPAAGAYRFALESIDGSQLTLDNRVVVDNPEGHTTIESNTELAQGWHDIVVHFSDKTSGTRIYLYWTPPGASERELVPSRYLSPPMGQYPATVPSQP